MITRLFVSKIFLGVLLTLSLSKAWAIPITYTNVYDPGTSTWTYSVEVENDTTELLFDLTLLSLPIPPSSAVEPLGWFPADIGTDFVHWMADVGSEIGPGDTLGGFSFSYIGGADDAIGPVNWEVLLDPSFSIVGGVTTPVATVAGVPEPATLLLLIIGLTAMGRGMTKKVKNL